MTTIIMKDGTKLNAERCLGFLGDNDKMFYVARIGGKTKWFSVTEVARVEVLDS